MLPTVNYAGKNSILQSRNRFSVLNQAINLSVDYYYRKGTDLIGSKALALENGFTNMSINWASMENKGVEINLQTRNITTKTSLGTLLSTSHIIKIKY